MKHVFNSWLGKSSEVKYTVLIMVILVAISFTAGFLWGKQRALAEFMVHLEQESFADKVFTSLCTLYEVNDQEEDDPTTHERQDS